MYRLIRFALTLGVLLLALPVLAAPGVEATPAQARPGAHVMVAVTEPGSGGRRLELAPTQGAPTVLLQVTADGSDTVYRARLPATQALGNYQLRLVASSTGSVLASAPFLVLSPLSLQLSPGSAPPGRAVDATVTGLRAGNLSLSFAGRTVLGPIPVADGSWTGRFLVPRNLPSSPPLTVQVEAINTIGRNALGSGAVNFQVLASSGLPRLRSELSEAPPATTVEGSRLAFGGQLLDDANRGSAGAVNFFWRSDDGEHVVPVDGGVETGPDGRYQLLAARAPDPWMDGVQIGPSGVRAGRLMGVVRDRDPDTGNMRLMSANLADVGLVSAAGTGSSDLISFTVQIRGMASGGPQPLQSVYVEALGLEGHSFVDPATSAPRNSMADLLVVQNQMRQPMAGLLASHASGCPLSFGHQFTNAQGRVQFAFDPEAARKAQFTDSILSLGEIRVQHAIGAPIPGIDTFPQGTPGVFLAKGKNFEIGDTYLSLRVRAGQQGYGASGYSTGAGLLPGEPDPLAGIALYNDTFLELYFDDSGQVNLLNPPGNGAVASVSGQIITLDLPPLPTGLEAGVAPYNVRVQGLRGNIPTSPSQPYEFKGMDSFPGGANAWSTVQFVQPNQGRKLRFAWENGFGAIRGASYQIHRRTGQFQREAANPCTLSGVDDWVADLPDMTHWPANGNNAAPMCFNGSILLDVVGLTQPVARTFTLCTQLPPARITSPQSKNVKIWARDMRYTGDLVLPETRADANNAQMRDWNIPPLNNRSVNEGSFVIHSPNDSFVTRTQVNTGTAHLLGSNPSSPTTTSASSFGFSGAPTRANILRPSVLETGNIPLFRYPWGWDPIAGATFGADFWLSASLAYYGTLGDSSESLMDATIDPTLNGGLDIFFDFSVLGGLISADLTATPQMGLSLKEVIGRGGLPGDVSGRCFGFNIDVAYEVCGAWVFCAEDRFNLLEVRSPSGCHVDMKSGREALRGQPIKPSLAPAAVATDGEGNSLVLEADADGTSLVAYHLAGSEVVATRVLSVAAPGVHDVAVQYFGPNRALAVWSQSSLSLQAIGSLMSSPGAARNNSDDIARAQVLRWSVYDGRGWSPPQPVPGAQSGSTGRPRLAAGRCLAITCLRNTTPPIYLVWEFDAASNFAAPDLEIWGAHFSPTGGFTGAVRISATGSSSDMSPTVAWVGARPLVAWISSPLPHYTQTSERRIHYRLVNDPTGGRLNTTVRNAGLPGGAGWPSLTGAGSSKAVLAFTVAQDSTVVGNRQALYMAHFTCPTDSDTCNISHSNLLDPRGRAYMAERPSVSLDSEGEVVIAFRGLGFGPDALGNRAHPSDSVGLVSGSGEFLALQVGTFDNPKVAVSPRWLSNDGLVHFRGAIAFDAAIDGFHAISRSAPLALQKHPGWQAAKQYASEAPRHAARAKGLGSSGLVMASLAATPDFRIEAVSLPADWLQPGSQLPLQVRLRNVGTDFNPVLLGTATLHAAWDAPQGAGVEAMAPVVLAALASNSERSFELVAQVPVDHHADEVRTLFVEVRLEVPEHEAMAEDNVAQVEVGAMPVPSGLSVATKLNSPIVFLEWSEIADPRVAGFRVYKRSESGDFVSYGSSTVAGYADLFAGFRTLEAYRVTSYSARGIESEPSEIMLAQPQHEAYLFGNGFD